MLRVLEGGFDKVREAREIEPQIETESSTKKHGVIGSDGVPIEHLGVALNGDVELVPEGGQVERVYFMNINNLLSSAIEN